MAHENTIRIERIKNELEILRESAPYFVKVSPPFSKADKLINELIELAEQQQAALDEKGN